MRWGLLFLAITLCGEAPPEGWIRKVIEREARTEAARNQYAYHQVFQFEELTTSGLATGRYREERDVVFLPDGRREDRVAGKPQNQLKKIILTAEDFEDIRNIQPMVLAPDQVRLYEFKYKGEDEFEGAPCWLLQVKPRQLLEGQRLFEGMLWVLQQDFSVVKLEGQAVPNRYGRKGESDQFFPHFTTIRRQVDGKHYFPVQTFADDVLPFRTGPVRVRFTLRYAEYQKFASESRIEF